MQVRQNSTRRRPRSRCVTPLMSLAQPPRPPATSSPAWTHPYLHTGTHGTHTSTYIFLYVHTRSMTHRCARQKTTPTRDLHAPRSVPTAQHAPYIYCAGVHCLCAAATRSYGCLRTKICAEQAANGSVNSQKVHRNGCTSDEFEGIGQRRTVQKVSNTFPGRRPIRPTP